MRTILAASLLTVLWVASAHASMMQASSTEKDSLDFAYKYEANSALPSVEDNGTGMTNWTFFNHTAIDAGFAVSDGVLSYSTMANIVGGDWFYSTSTVSGSAWAANVDVNTSYTIELCAKITNGAGTVPGLHVVASAGGDTKMWLLVAPDHIAVSNGYTDTVLTTSDNASDYHIYRMAYDAVATDFTIWRDGLIVADDVTATTSGAAYLGFGDMSSYGSGAGEIDYLRWDATGAYAPVVPEPSSAALLLIGMLSLGLLRRVFK